MTARMITRATRAGALKAVLYDITDVHYFVTAMISNEFETRMIKMPRRKPPAKVISLPIKPGNSPSYSIVSLTFAP